MASCVLVGGMVCPKAIALAGDSASNSSSCSESSKALQNFPMSPLDLGMSPLDLGMSVVQTGNLAGDSTDSTIIMSGLDWG